MLKRIFSFININQKGKEERVKRTYKKSEPTMEELNIIFKRLEEKTSKFTHHI